MSVTKEVTVSGTVGKQVFSSTKQIILDSVILTSITSAATVIIRDGNASGDVSLTVNTPVGESEQYFLSRGMRFDNGMHIKVTGLNAKCYLVIK